MAQARVATELDRLPWLRDEREPQQGGGVGWLVFWVTIALAVVAGASFWVGLNNGVDEEIAGVEGNSAATFLTPEREAPEPAPPVAAPAPVMPQVQPSAPPPPIALPRANEVRIATPERVSKPARRTAAAKTSKRVTQKRTRASAAKSATRLRPWSAWQSAGAAGRVVRIGTFASSRQAKRGWTRLARAYPITRLPAVVVGSRSLRNGRTYYRLQIGTTSHAHSEVLCQRMRIIGQSCVVVGVQGKRG